MKPVIGVSTATGWESNRLYTKATRFYADSVVAGGGLPLYIPTLPEADLAADFVSRIDGLILSGGNDDVQPHHFGEIPIKGLKYVNPERDEWEFALIRAALEQNKPIFGICRGCQVLNVALGGSLYQSLHKQFEGAGEHMPIDTDMFNLYHAIDIEEDSLLYRLYGDSIMVNSYHNLAVKDPASCFRVTARSGEGIIECIESTEHDFVIGVQWHPEALTARHPHFVKLFEAHVNACQA